MLYIKEQAKSSRGAMLMSPLPYQATMHQVTWAFFFSRPSPLSFLPKEPSLSMPFFPRIWKKNLKTERTLFPVHGFLPTYGKKKQIWKKMKRKRRKNQSIFEELLFLIFLSFLCFHPNRNIRNPFDLHQVLTFQQISEREKEMKRKKTKRKKWSIYMGKGLIF